MNLLLFVSSNCRHCPKTEAVARRVVPAYYGHDINFEKIRVKTIEGKQLASRFNVMSLPTILMLDNDGNEIKRIVGLPSEENLRNDIEKGLGMKKSILSKIFDR